MMRLLKGYKLYLVILSVISMLLLESCHNNIPCPVYADMDFEPELSVAR